MRNKILQIFETTKGVRGVETLSSHLFNLVMYEVIKEGRKKTKRKQHLRKSDDNKRRLNKKKLEMITTMIITKTSKKLNIQIDFILSPAYFAVAIRERYFTHE